MKMPRNKKMITLALEPALLERLERWMNKQDLPPTKTLAFEKALAEFLDKRDG
jgi:hypothetical protein